MKILALDSSGLVASVAVVEDDILVAEYTVNYKKTHSQTLLPIDSMLLTTRLSLESALLISESHTKSLTLSEFTSEGERRLQLMLTEDVSTSQTAALTAQCQWTDPEAFQSMR